MKKPLPPTYFTVSLGTIVLFHLFLPIRDFLSLPVSLIGLLPSGAGVYLNLAADRLFKLRSTTVIPFEQSSSLVEDFPFSVTRNPMYLGMTFILLGLGLLLGTVGGLIPVVLFPVIIDRQFIREEERMLAAAFGETWEEYRSRVRRWL
jgi:protein-S-isoprenylcysteine O-methyltransferase Ste14